MKLDDHTLNALYRYCFALTSNEHSAYDLVQDTVERALKKRRTIESLPPYLRAIARNRFYDLEKQRNRQYFDVLEDIDELVDDASDMEAVLVDQNLLQAIWGQLNPPEREVVFLWAVDGLSASQIASELGCPRATVLSRLRRMRIRLSEQLEIWGGASNEQA